MIDPAYQQSVFSFISSFIGQSNVIPIQIELVRFTGDYNTAALLTQLIYWQGKQKDPEGWIYKTYEQWEKEIALSKFQTSRSVKTLIRMGILETKVARVKIGEHYGDKAVHYRLLQDKLINSLGKHLKILDSKETSLSKVKKLDYPSCSNSTILPIYTETTYKDYDDVQTPEELPPPFLPGEKPSSSFPSDHDKNDLIQSIPQDKRSVAVEKVIEKAILNHGVDDIKSAIAYTLKNSKGSKQQFKAYLGKTLENGWFAGYEAESPPPPTPLTDEERAEERARAKSSAKREALITFQGAYPDKYKSLEVQAAKELGYNLERLKPGQLGTIKFKIMQLMGL